MLDIGFEPSLEPNEPEPVKCFMCGAEATWQGKYDAFLCDSCAPIFAEMLFSQMDSDKKCEAVGLWMIQ